MVDDGRARRARDRFDGAEAEERAERRSRVRPRRCAIVMRAPAPESAEVAEAYERLVRAPVVDEWFGLEPVADDDEAPPKIDTERPGARLDAGERWFAITPVERAGMQQRPSDAPNGDSAGAKATDRKRGRRKSTKAFGAPRAVVIDLDALRTRNRRTKNRR